MANYVNYVPSWELFAKSNNFVYKKGGYLRAPLLFGKLNNKEIAVTVDMMFIVNYGPGSTFYVQAPSMFSNDLLVENKNIEKLRTYLAGEQYDKWVSALKKHKFRMKVVKRRRLLKEKHAKYLCLHIFGIIKEEAELSKFLHLLVSL